MEKEKLNWRRLLITIGLVLVTAGITGGGVWYFMDQANQTQKKTIDSMQAQIDQLNENLKNGETSKSLVDETANWNTYTSSLEKLSFKYPEDWTIATGDNAPIKTVDQELVRFIAPARIIDGVEYQYTFTFHVHQFTPIGINDLPIYSATKIDVPGYSSPLFSMITLFNGPTSSSNYGKTSGISLSPSSNDSKVSIETSTKDRIIDIGGGYFRTSDNTVAYFQPSQLADFLEIKQTNKIFSTLKQTK
ncbi:hypothetical protein HGB13_03825 [bacterium]|nr:hypothetical protein [bacterium]